MIPDKNTFHLEYLKTYSEAQIAVRANNSSFIHSKQRKAQSKNNIFSLNINLLSMSGSLENSVFYFNGEISGNQILPNDFWFGNAWTIDHPYGNKIFKRTWRPAIFLSKSDKSFDIILAQMKKQNSPIHIRGIQSYRITMKSPE